MRALRIAIVSGLVAGWLAAIMWASPPVPGVAEADSRAVGANALAPLYCPLVISNGAMPGVSPTSTVPPTVAPDPTPTPTSFPGAASYYGVIVPVSASYCMAGETHFLQGAGVFLYSDAHGVDLAAYEGAYVQVWGRMVDSPECQVMAVLAIAEFVPPVL